MAQEPVCEVKGISKRFGPVQALDNVSLSINQGEILGLVGENGAGKSTLLKVMCGLYPRDEGVIEFKGTPVDFRNYHEAALAGMAMVFQEQALVPNMRVYENLLLSHEKRFSRVGVLSKKQMIKAARQDLHELGLQNTVDPKRLTGSYDYHTRQMIEITRAFTLPRLIGITTPLILLDEPTEGLTEHEVTSLFKRMRAARERASLIFVSHRLSEVLDVCDRVVVFKDGKVIAETPVSGCTVSILHELMVGRERDTFYYREHDQLASAPDVVLEVTGLGKKGAFSDVSLSLHKDEILGIAGVLGSGKEEVGRAIVGALKADEGKVTLNGVAQRLGSSKGAVKNGIGYVPKERSTEGIIAGLSVSWNISLPSFGRFLNRLGILRAREERRVAREYVKKLAIKTPSINHKLQNLSGGNQQKVVVAKWLAADLKAIVLENPTRGIDVGAKHELYTLFREIVKNGVPIILISDELLELIGLSNRILVMKDRRVIDEIAAPADAKPTEKQLVQHMV